MQFIIYWLISENYKRTYIGFTSDFKKRIGDHRRGRVRTTKNFGKFRCFILEKASDLEEARLKEKYWKSHAGRKKLKLLFKKVKK